MVSIFISSCTLAEEIKFIYLILYYLHAQTFLEKNIYNRYSCYIDDNGTSTAPWSCFLTVTTAIQHS